MTKPKWNFPLNNNGREDGLNDPGIETFRDDPLRSLAREVAQNSLDADDPESGKPVEVHFSVEDLRRSDIPDADRLARTFTHCGKYWKSNEAARKFFHRAGAIMEGTHVRVMKIQDYNTTGLTGPFTERTSHWFKLTKAVGVSDKLGGAGGSFGIGKHAPFACSELRTVLYGTLDKRGEFAFQGVSKLVTHAAADQETTQGTGYYGKASKNEPITELDEVEAIFRRSQVGTDLYILGFLQAADWEEQVVKGLVESFFVSIHRGMLVARVGSTLVNQASLPALVENYSRADRSWLPGFYYRALTSEETRVFIEEDFEGLGRIELRAMTGPDFPKRVAMVRGTGMKIYDKGRFQTPLRFAGVFLASGDPINALLRSLEPPSHNLWVADRHENPTFARGVLRKLNAWLHERIRLLSAEADVEELDAEGVSQFLPDEAEEGIPSSEAAEEGERNEPLPDIPVLFRKAQEHERSAAVSEAAEEDGEVPAPDDDLPKIEGAGRENGDSRSVDDRGEGDSTPAGGPGPSGPTFRRIGLRRVRVYCSDDREGRYRIICEPEESGDGFLTVRIIGEVGQDVAPVREFLLEGSSTMQKPARPGVIGPVQMRKDARLELDVVLEGAPHCALGVTAHAD